MKKSVILIFVVGFVYSAAFSQLKIGTDGHVGIGSYAPTSSYNLRLGSANFKQTVRFDGSSQFYQPATFNSSVDFNSNSVTFSRIWVDSYVGIMKAPTSPWGIDIHGAIRVFTYTNNHIIINNEGAYYSCAIYPQNNNTCTLGKSNKRFNNIYTYNLDKISDGRQKEKIRDIEKPLELILNIKGVKYDLKKEYAYDETIIQDPDDILMLEEKRKNKFGFIAQDVYEVIPEVVRYDDSTDVYGMEYMELIPVLVEAIKVQNEMILKLEEKIKDKDEKSAEEPIIEDDAKATLGKNRPNPFNENTIIDYYLPSTVHNAVLYVYDLQGKQLRNIKINEREKGQVIIYGSELQAGIYHYSLIADGHIIGIEKMVLTD